MQPVQVAQQCADYRNRRFPLLEDAAEHAFDPHGIAFGCRHHRIVQLERRRVADREPGILELDPAALAGVERELFEFGARQQAIAPEVLDQELAGVAARGDPVRRQGLADHRGQLARRIGIAADRDGRLRRLEGPAQRRAGRQLARLDNDQCLAGRALQKPRKQLGERVAGAAHAHHPPPAGQAQLGGFVGEPRGIGGERRRHQIGDAKRIFEVGTDRTRHRFGALTHQALIRAVQQHGANFRIGPLQKRGNPRRGEPHNRSARRWGLLGEPALHEQGEPGHDLLVEFGGAANRGIVFADHGGILVRIEIEGICDVHRVDQQGLAALAVDQVVGRVNVELAERRQTLRLDAEIAQTA